jgi:hypothetical protein
MVVRCSLRGRHSSIAYEKPMPKCFAIHRGGERVGAEELVLISASGRGYIGFSHNKHSILLLVRASWRVQRRDAPQFIRG